MNNIYIIVGAPRSGTNMLRDRLTSFTGIGTWPCDEINYIWRHGNVRYPSDELPVELVTPFVKGYIRKKFLSLLSSEKFDFVVEKTCANSLRVPFVNSVLPEAKFIFIYRDGIDAAGSAKLRWTAKIDLWYILKKVRFVPKSDIPFYAIRYMWSRVYRFFSGEKRLAFWGPSLDGMKCLLENHSLMEICALQWQKSVDSAEAAFSELPEGKVIRLCYEDFVSHPERELGRVLEFMGRETSKEEISEAVKGVSTKSLGKGRKALMSGEVKKLERLVGSSLKRYGYL